ncbi:MAG TPA: ATP-binding protein [candidate division Zixibacteria bacterium]|nr:ATP-binding protein [candidate division Zixibacteria bacterium]
MRQRRMLWQLFPSFVLVVALAAGGVYLYTRQAYRTAHYHEAVHDLEMRARLAERVITPYLDAHDNDALDSLVVALGRAGRTRFTVVGADGRVLADSEEDPKHMEQHRFRPEIAAALRGEMMASRRYSSTLQRHMLYTAVPVLADDRVVGVVRTAIPEDAAEGGIGTVTGTLAGDVVVGGLLLVLLAAVISRLVARSVVRPIGDLRAGADRFARGEFDYALPAAGHQEIAGLAQAMNEMAAQLHERMEAIGRRRNEQEAILAAMVEGVLAVDTSERILTLNAAAARLLRIRPEEAVGRSVPEVVRNSELHRLGSETLHSGAPVEGTIELAGDDERQLQVHGTTLRDGSGNAAGGVIVLNDITRLRRLENIRTDFVANVSHELRTPVTSIKGFLETLLDGAMDRPEDARRFLEIIKRQADQLNNIIEDLLALSRLEQERDGEGCEVTRRPVGGVLRSAVQSCESRAREKGIALLCEGDLDLVAPINPSLLEQALVNLLSNAITYGPAGSTVRAGARRSVEGVELFVADEGPGIEPRYHERIFERFYRIDKARSRDQGGTGLGLAIVKHIARAHKGRVTVRSAVGQGSTFSIHLPHSA